MDILNALKELEDFCKNLGIQFSGELRILDEESYLPTSQQVEYHETIVRNGIIDRCGPYVMFKADVRPIEVKNIKNDSKITLRDKEISFKKESVISPRDGKAYPNRASWDDHLKRYGCVELGNDIKPTARATQMKDMNLKPAIRQAIEEVRSRQN